ncbi:hypothetical protein KUTeg_000227 [Tegillarca granosa]|uniref:HAT C-terminal dimerisation domain-containing protein n=1 Tax=Tegillarca granosa TaxID=220873 RepID=A0ABQ9FWY9_TEGGR|nr:hypothetical protein KUTeg_000227 [Tegillarca granosa]
MESLNSFLKSVSIKESDLESELIGFHGYIRGMGCSKSISTVRDVAQIAVRQICSYPVVGMLAKRLLVLPVSTVDCERGFSKQNIIKTDLRNSLKISTLENLMRISIKGPSNSADFNFEMAFDIWSKKARRILN